MKIFKNQYRIVILLVFVAAFACNQVKETHNTARAEKYYSLINFRCYPIYNSGWMIQIHPDFWRGSLNSIASQYYFINLRSPYICFTATDTVPNFIENKSDSLVLKYSEIKIDTFPLNLQENLGQIHRVFRYHGDYSCYQDNIKCFRNKSFIKIDYRLTPLYCYCDRKYFETLITDGKILYHVLETRNPRMKTLQYPESEPHYFIRKIKFNSADFEKKLLLFQQPRDKRIRQDRYGIESAFP